MRKSKKLFKKIQEELEKTGLVSDVCAKVGISRQTFYRWQREDESFRNMCLESLQIGVEFINDIAKSNYINAIQGGDLKASGFWLTNRDYGFRKNKERALETKPLGSC